MYRKIKSPIKGLLKKIGRRLTLPPVKAVPSALLSLTSLFGMGRGGPQRYSHLKALINCEIQLSDIRERKYKLK